MSEREGNTFQITLQTGMEFYWKIPSRRMTMNEREGNTFQIIYVVAPVEKFQQRLPSAVSQATKIQNFCEIN
jgi:hypothetical protein